MVQNTAWANVERALGSLRHERILEPGRLGRLNAAAMRRRLRPAGTFRQKAGLVRRFLSYLRNRHGGSLRRMFRLPGWHLRADLLRIKGIGPETADSILLYAGGKTAFVVGEYTRRVLGRHKIADRKAGYDQLQQLFEVRLPRDAVLYKEYHALLVAAGKRYCHRREPDCARCPLRPELPGGLAAESHSSAGEIS